MKHRLIFLLFLPFLVTGQNKNESFSLRTRNIIWTIPVSKNTTINGIAVGFFPVTWGKAKYLNINGVAISVSPLDPFIGIYSLFDTFYSFSKDTLLALRSTSFNTNNLYTDSTKESISINGVMVGTFTGIKTRFNGIDVSVIANTAQSLNGLAISGLFNQHHSFKGVLIAGIRNKTTTGKGLQIALFNSCQKGKVVQIELVNKIGKRILPVLNFQL